MFVLLLGLPAHARDAELKGAVDQASAELEAWDIEAAAKILDELVQSHPRAAETSWLRGRVLFEQGRYEEADAAFAEAEDRAGSANGLQQDRRLAQAAAAEVKEAQAFESAHFVLKAKGKDALLAPYALDGLEKAYAALTKDLGYEPPTKIRVEVYESAQSLAKVSPLTVAEIKASGTIALCKYNRLMITTPRALLRGYPWIDTLSHEFTHYLVTRKGRGNVPIWLQEGLAKFLETRWRGEPGLAVEEISLKLLQDAAKKNTLIPFSAMHPSIAKLPTQEKAALAFAEVEAAIRLLYTRGGQQALTELVAAMAHGSSDEQAVAQAYGKSFPAFEADWRADVAKPRGKAATAQQARPLGGRKLVFKEDARGRKDKDPSAPEGGDDLFHEPPKPPEAKRRIRLAELLFARGRWGAAAHEYGLARKALPEEDPVVARRYAYAELQLGGLADARAALEAAVLREPQDETAQALLAQVRLAQDDTAGTKAALEAGVSVDPFDPRLHQTFLQLARKTSDKPLEQRAQAALALLQGRRPDEPQSKAPASPASAPRPPAPDNAQGAQPPSPDTPRPTAPDSARPTSPDTARPPAAPAHDTSR